MQNALSLIENPLIHGALILAAAIAAISILVSLGRRLIRARIADNSLRYKASKLLGVVGYVLFVVVLASEFAGRLSGFTVAIGAASAGVAFALQEVIASFAGWLAIVFANFFKVGDRVQLGGIRGDVMDIGFLRTTLMEIGDWVKGDLYNGRIVRVANSFVFKEPVFNYSGEFNFLWDEIIVPVKYGSDYELARRLLEASATSVVGEFVETARHEWLALTRGYRLEHAQVEPMVTMVFNDNWVEFTVRYVVAHRARRITKDRLSSSILSAIETTGGAVGIASATVHIVETPEFKVQLSAPS